MADKSELAKKAAVKPEPEPKQKAPAKAEEKPAEAVDSPPTVSAVPKAEKKAEPVPEPVKAAGYVLTEDRGWVLEEEV